MIGCGRQVVVSYELIYVKTVVSWRQISVRSKMALDHQFVRGAIGKRGPPMYFATLKLEGARGSKVL